MSPPGNSRQDRHQVTNHRQATASHSFHWQTGFEFSIVLKYTTHTHLTNIYGNHWHNISQFWLTLCQLIGKLRLANSKVVVMKTKCFTYLLFWKCLSNMLKSNKAWKYDSQEYRIYIQVRSNKSNEKGCVCLYSANGKVWILIVKNNKKLTQKYFMICLYKYWNKSVKRVKM